MTLAAGSKLGPYEIVSPLGAGGMGEVYRARDTRLEREVALKLLPAGVLGDAAARGRLIEEAKTASGLNHPHICTIHEVGEADGQTYVAMEYVEGRPLSQQIPHDGLPLELVLRYGGQIADGLAYAHEHGIVHRDLKTANVMITPDGRAKVLDFGLARRMAGSELSEATLSKQALGESGEISGTLQYMAPEALRGEAVDVRSDVWALGVVLYEMAAGRLPFGGKTAYELTSAILREPVAALPARVPAGLRSVIQRCLAKEAGQRYSRIGEVRSALEAIGSSDTLAATPAATSGQVHRKLARILLAAGIVLVVAALGFVLRGRIAGSKQGAAASGEAAKLSGPRTSTGGRASPNREANDYFERGMLFMETQFDGPRAQQMFEHALALDPKFGEARAWHGVSLMSMVDAGYSNDSAWLYKAEEELRRALDEDANSAAAYCGLANLYFFLGRKELSLEVTEKALKVAPDLACAQNSLGGYHMFSGNNAEAKAIYRRVLDKSPLYGPAQFCLAEALRTEGDLITARRVAETLLEQNPNDHGARLLLSFVYEDSGDFKKAQDLLDAAPGKGSEPYYDRLGWARLRAAEGKRNMALREMDEDLLKFLEVNKWNTIQAAEIFSAGGETDRSLDWLERAVNGGDERVEWFRRDPMLKNIRSHPRFQQILASATARRKQRGAVQATP